MNHVTEHMSVNPNTIKMAKQQQTIILYLKLVFIKYLDEVDESEFSESLLDENTGEIKSVNHNVEQLLEGLHARCTQTSIATGTDFQLKKLPAT